jgi:formylglycine-generating enzyme required for sulfatase activity
MAGAVPYVPEHLLNAPGPRTVAPVEPRAASRPVRCPRCDAPIEGDYKFCPACAQRLRSTTEEDLLAPARARSPWRTGFLVVTALAVALACVLVGVVLFHPSLLDHRSAEQPGTPGAHEYASLAEPVITVAEMPADLIEIPPGDAYEVPLEAVPGLDDLMPGGDETVRDHWDAILRARYPGREPKLVAFLGYPLRILKYEVTRGQYAEFLRDVETNRDRIPRVWLESDRVERPEDVDLFLHTPDAWEAKDVDGVPRSWEVPLADRNLPVAQVSYVDALGFCEWASERLGLEIRIPFAMEWVRAARGGRLDYLWPWGNRPLIYACNNSASWGRPQYVHYRYSEPMPSGGLSPEGLYAMAGNVREYALDHDLKLIPQAMGEPPRLSWEQWDQTPETIWAYGGSFRAGIDDCTVEDKEVYAKTDASHDDVGFRVVVRLQPR